MRGLIPYIEGLPVSQGELAGENVRLLPWERKFIAGAFSPGVSVAALSIGRGNGKTTLTATLESWPETGAVPAGGYTPGNQG